MLKAAKNKFGPPRVYGAAHVCVFKASGTLPIDLPAREQLAGGDLVVFSEIGYVFDFEANDLYPGLIILLHVLFSPFHVCQLAFIAPFTDSVMLFPLTVVETPPSE